MSKLNHDEKPSQAKTDARAKKPAHVESIDLLGEDLTDEQLEAVAGGGAWGGVSKSQNCSNVQAGVKAPLMC